MAVNLTPQYHEAEAEYKTRPDRRGAAGVPEEDVDAGAQAQGQRKAPGRAEDEDQRDQGRGRAASARSPKKAGVSYKIPRQGAGQVILVGGPNAGKSRLLTRLTRATPEVAPLPVHHPRAVRRHDGLGRRARAAHRHAAHHRRLSSKAMSPAWCAPPTPPSWWSTSATTTARSPPRPSSNAWPRSRRC